MLNTCDFTNLVQTPKTFDHAFGLGLRLSIRQPKIRDLGMHLLKEMNKSPMKMFKLTFTMLLRDLELTRFLAPERDIFLSQNGISTFY